MDLLNERIVTARIIEAATDDREVRFGTTVTFTHVTGKQKDRTFTFTLVGVDVASVKDGKIAFTAPIAQALIGTK